MIPSRTYIMGSLRQAKDGHCYRYRRTRGGRYYTVPSAPPRESYIADTFLICLFIGVMAAPFTYLLSIPAMLLLAWILALSYRE